MEPNLIFYNGKIKDIKLSTRDLKFTTRPLIEYGATALNIDETFRLD